MRLGVEAAIVDGVLLPGDVEIEGELVTGVGLAGHGHGVAAPGLVDLQVNGFAGVDLAHADAAGYELVRRGLASAGTTSFQPTLVSAGARELVRALEILTAARGPRDLGVHLEGPFLSPSRLGAHLPEHRRDPDSALLERLLDAGVVSQMTLAPELPGALGLIDRLHARDVVVSLGHTDATGDEARRAFARGVRTVTHLCNAMRPFGHRDAGIVGAALADPEVIVQLIVDGTHLDPDAVRVVWQSARGRVALVSDAIAAAGLGDGRFPLGPGEVVVENRVARRADGVLAGSTCSMLEAVRNVHALGVPLVEAIDAATRTPARIARRPDLGELRPGSVADIVVLDDRLELRATLLAGRPFEPS